MKDLIHKMCGKLFFRQAFGIAYVWSIGSKLNFSISERAVNPKNV